VPTVPKRRGWLDKEFAEYEIAAIVSAAITRGAILSTSFHDLGDTFDRKSSGEYGVTRPLADI